MKTKKKGFTLIELLIALSIMGVVATAITIFFFNNYKILKDTSIEIDLQREGEKVINSIVEKAMGSKGITLLKNGNVDILDNESHADGNAITEIAFGSAYSENKHYIFELYNNKLLYAEAEISKVLDKDGILNENEVKPEKIFENVEEIVVNANEKYKDSRSISIKMRMKINEKNTIREKTVNSEVYFRNK